MINECYDFGSVLIVYIVVDVMMCGGDVLLMDVDVLYDENILYVLVVDVD